MPPSHRAAPRPGAPRTPEYAERLERYDAVAQPVVLLAAVLPIIMGLVERRDVVAGIVYVATWLVFLVDLVVRERLTVHYLRTWRGRFDLAVVLLTVPWFFIPGLGHSRYLVVVRLARVARVIVATAAARRLLERIGRAVVIATSLVFVCSYVAYRAEEATNPSSAVTATRCGGASSRSRPWATATWCPRRAADAGPASCSWSPGSGSSPRSPGA